MNRKEEKHQQQEREERQKKIHLRTKFQVSTRTTGFRVLKRSVLLGNGVFPETVLYGLSRTGLGKMQSVFGAII